MAIVRSEQNIKCAIYKFERKVPKGAKLGHKIQVKKGIKRDNELLKTYLFVAEKADPLTDIWDSPFLHLLPWVRASQW